MNTATAGVGPADSGIASALVNVGQQVGGSIGISLLNTLAAGATRNLPGNPPHRHSAERARNAARRHRRFLDLSRHGIFALGAVLCGLLLRSGVRQRAPGTSPAFAARRSHDHTPEAAMLNLLPSSWSEADRGRAMVVRIVGGSVGQRHDRPANDQANQRPPADPRRGRPPGHQLVSRSQVEQERA